MSVRHDSKDPAHQPRRDSLYEPHRQDPYQAREKWREPTVCPDCGAVYQKGRWQWGEAPEGAHAQRCPACARIHDRVPAGFLTLAGDFLVAHKDEILSLIKNHEQDEKARHPLERIMAIEDTDKGITVSFTGLHLARSSGEAVHHAYQGDLDIHHAERDAQIRVRWTR